MVILAWMVAGLIVGGIARLLIPGRQSMGLLMTMGLGIAGALLGGGISYAIWGLPTEPFAAYAWPGYIFSILGAMAILWFSLSASQRQAA